jgi:hypothetical protein
MLRKLAVVAAVTAMFGLGPVGTAVADTTAPVNGPTPMTDFTCVFVPIAPQCIVGALIQTLSSGSASTGSAT